jgi:hypothetical protein
MTLLGPKDSKYQTNFKKYPQGNGIEEGSELIVRIKGAETVTGQLRGAQNQVIQIDQSHAYDEDNDAETVNFVLKTKRWGGLRNNNLPPGVYTLICWFWDNDVMTGGSYTDKFIIVAKN